MAIPPDGKFRSLSRIARFPVGIDSYARPQGPPEGLPLSGPCHPDRGRLSDALRSWFEAASLEVVGAHHSKGTSMKTKFRAFMASYVVASVALMGTLGSARAADDKWF